MNRSYIKSLLCILSTLVLFQVSFAADISPGKYVTLTTEQNQSFEVYVSGNENAKHAILIIPEWWGLNPDIRRWTNEFAQRGYRAMAIDLYNGKVASEPQYARQLMQAVRQKEANAKYKSALNALARPGRKLAIIGASYGGSQALHAALVAPEKISATVMYYPFGKLVQDRATLSMLQSPLLGHFANQDFAFTADKFREFRKAIKVASKSLKPYIYEAKHGFAKPAGKNFNQKAYQLAQQRTLRFLETHLK